MLWSEYMGLVDRGNSEDCGRTKKVLRLANMLERNSRKQFVNTRYREKAEVVTESAGTNQNQWARVMLQSKRSMDHSQPVEYQTPKTLLHRPQLERARCWRRRGFKPL